MTMITGLFINTAAAPHSKNVTDAHLREQALEALELCNITFNRVSRVSKQMSKVASIDGGFLATFEDASDAIKAHSELKQSGAHAHFVHLEKPVKHGLNAKKWEATTKLYFVSTDKK